MLAELDFRFVLYVFNVYVISGDSISVWTSLVEQLARYVTVMGRGAFCGIGQYQKLGRMVFRRYPCIKREGKSEWV